jgi:Asp-tRNA(Asn)/Glu-tRNA(Gln) amidotransferase A subunit family amidase
VPRMRRFGRAVSSPILASDGKFADLCGIDDPELYDGAYVGVQIVARRFQEEKVLALTEILGDALGKHVV